MRLVPQIAAGASARQLALLKGDLCSCACRRVRRSLCDIPEPPKKHGTPDSVPFTPFEFISGVEHPPSLYDAPRRVPCV